MWKYIQRVMNKAFFYRICHFPLPFILYPTGFITCLALRCWSLTFIWQHSIQSWKWYQQVRPLCWISLCVITLWSECTCYSACIPMCVFIQPTCVCEGGRPLRPYTPTRASLWTEMLNFKNCGWSMYSWDLQKTPVVKNNNKQNGVKSAV